MTGRYPALDLDLALDFPDERFQRKPHVLAQQFLVLRREEQDHALSAVFHHGYHRRIACSDAVRVIGYGLYVLDIVVESVYYYQLFFASGDHGPVSVDVRQISRDQEPVFREGARIHLRIAVIRGDDLISSHLQLSGLPFFQDIAVAVRDTHHRARHRLSDRYISVIVRRRLQTEAVVIRYRRRSFRHPEGRLETALRESVFFELFKEKSQRSADVHLSACVNIRRMAQIPAVVGAVIHRLCDHRVCEIRSPRGSADKPVHIGRQPQRVSQYNRGVRLHLERIEVHVSDVRPDQSRRVGEVHPVEIRHLLRQTVHLYLAERPRKDVVL